MSIKYDGVVFDTVEELIQYQRLSAKKSKVETTIVPKPKRKYTITSRGFKRFTKQELKLIKEALESSGDNRLSLKRTKKLAKELGRTKHSIYNIAYRINTGLVQVA